MNSAGLTIRDILRRSARAHGPKTAVTYVVDGTEISRVSYDELYRDVNALAKSILAAGMRPGERIAVLAENSYDFCRFVLAAGNAGMVAASLNVLLSKDDMQVVLRELQPAAIVGDSAILTHHGLIGEGVDPGVPVWEFPLGQAGEGQGLPVPSSEDGLSEPDIDLSADDPCLILYTSGSTATPRGVVISHRNIVMNALNTGRGWGFRREDRVLVGLPMYHVGIWNTTLMTALVTGATVVIVNGLNAATIFDELHATRATVALALPFMFKVMGDAVKSSARGRPPLRLALYGMAGMPEELAKTIRKDLHIQMASGFGQTESGGNTLILEDRDHDAKCGSLGRPVLNTDVELIDSDGNALPPRSSRVGELVYRGPSVAHGYHESGGLADGGFGQWFHSGDLAYEDEDGFFWFQGRVREVIKSGGENVYAGKVEQILAGIDGIVDVAVIGRPSERWGEEVIAYVVLHDSSDLDAEAIREASRHRLAAFEVPKEVLVIDAMPRSAAGKIAKRQLRDL